jgi:hypothetical protein
MAPHHPPDGSSVFRAWAPNAQSNSKANASQHKLRMASHSALNEWEPTADPGPQAYEVESSFSPKVLRGPPGFGRSGVLQRPEPRIKVHPLGRTLGPGTYDITGFGSFSRYESARQEPWRTDRPTSRAAKQCVFSHGRPNSTRARDALADDPERASPGPGEYNMERYSQFLVLNSYNNYARSTRPATSSFGTSSRSDITMAHGDRSCRIQCPQMRTPATNRYSTVPHLDRITLSSASSSRVAGVGPLEPMSRGKTPFQNSAQSLRLTLSDIAAHSPDRARRPDLTMRFKATSPPATASR